MTGETGTLRRRWYLAAMMLVVGGGAVAQDAPTGDTVVVTGRKIAPKAAVQRFVRQIAATTDGQLSRYGDPVCPLVLGLSAASNRAIEDRIRTTAAAARIKAAKVKCAPNLTLVIAQDADVFVAALRKRFPAMFAGLSTAELRRALADGPVHGWSIVEVRNEDGQSIGGTDDDGVKVLQVRSASRITQPTQQSVVESILVIDAAATVGKSLTQIADYAAMRTLAGATPPAERGPADTILTLFDAHGTPPSGLTAFDTSYLRGLYRTRSNGRAIGEMSVISRTILKDAAPKD